MAAAESIVKEQTRKPSSDLSGLSLIAGLGASGTSAARFIHAHGGALRVIDSRAVPPGLADVSALGAEVITETLDPRYLDGVDRLVLSPGLSIELPIVDAARERGIEVLNDIEIFARVCEAPVIAVTGSNGKSTVVSVLEQMLRDAGLDAAAGGNLGTPALDLLERDAGLYVLEISSFQMEAADSLSPLAAAVLNISADHLDRHIDMNRYASLKEKLLRDAQTAVINVDDRRVRAMGARHGRTIEFSLERVLERGYSIVDDAIAIDAKPVLALDELAMQGRHNAANALAALALARTCANSLEPMLDALRNFAGLPHRCELVATIDGVQYINDSKATNTGATAAALDGLSGPIVLIAGGVGKGADFSELREFVRDKVRTIIVLGESADELQQILGDLSPVHHVAGIDAAVALASEQSRTGDRVLLSPACASLDMFADYMERGRAFRNAVQGLSS